MDTDAVTELRDLDALATWFRHRIDPAELAYLGPATVAARAAYRDGKHALRRYPPTAALVAAALACQAVDVITGAGTDRGRSLAPLLRDVHTSYCTGQVPSPRGPMILFQKRLSSLSQPLRHKVLRSVDTQLPVTERLRYCPPAPQPRTHQRPVPQPPTALGTSRDTSGRTGPSGSSHRGAHVHELAVNYATALPIPGNPARNVHATDELGGLGHQPHRPDPEVS